MAFLLPHLPTSLNRFFRHGLFSRPFRVNCSGGIGGRFHECGHFTNRRLNGTPRIRFGQLGAIADRSNYIIDRRLQEDGADANANGTVDYYRASINSAVDYYAFGSPQPNRKFNSGDYRYGFNGKENDRETTDPGEGTQDYGMRIYNPSIGRFLSIDPSAAKYPWNSVYAFAENDVIRCIDLNGADGLPVNIVSTNYGPVQIKNDGYTLNELLEELRKPLGPSTPPPSGSGPRYLIRGLLTVALVFQSQSFGTGDDLNSYYQIRLNQIRKTATAENLQIFTDDPSTLPLDYLTLVRQRLLSGTASAQDQKYRSEVQKRIVGVNDKLIDNDEHIPWKKVYNYAKGVVPDNVDKLWESRSYYDEKSQTWWSVEGEGKDAVFHRFSGKNAGGNFHWSGSSNGKNKNGKDVKLEDTQIPKELLKQARKPNKKEG